MSQSFCDAQRPDYHPAAPDFAFSPAPVGRGMGFIPFSEGEKPANPLGTAASAAAPLAERVPTPLPRSCRSHYTDSLKHPPPHTLQEKSRRKVFWMLVQGSTGGFGGPGGSPSHWGGHGWVYSEVSSADLCHFFCQFCSVHCAELRKGLGWKGTFKCHLVPPHHGRGRLS